MFTMLGLSHVSRDLCKLFLSNLAHVFSFLTYFSMLRNDAVGPDVTAAPPPTPGRIDILVTKDVITQLDLTPAHEVFRKYVYQIGIENL